MKLKRMKQKSLKTKSLNTDGVQNEISKYGWCTCD